MNVRSALGVVALVAATLSACGDSPEEATDEFANTCYDDPSQAGCDGEESEAPTTRLGEAYDTCVDDWPASERLSLVDGDNAIIANGVKATHDEFDDLVCIFLALETPQTVIAQVDSTTSLMGRQTAESNGLAYAWSFHPDNGIDMIIEEN